MKVVILGAPRRRELDCWKDHIADAGVALGWDVIHRNAKGIPVDDVIRMCKDADMLLWARTHSHEPHGDAFRMLRTVEEAGTKTVGVHLDLYWGIPERERRLRALAWPTCQYLFTADGGNQDKFAKIGINHYWCPPPISRTFFGRGERSSRYPFPVVFVGSLVRNIHGPHRMQLLSWARRRYGTKFAHYGLHRNHVYGSELNRLYASARVVLGDSAPSSHYWSDRVPRTLGRGGLLAYPATAGMAEWGFSPENMLVYRRFGFENLGDQIDALTDVKRKEMTEAAMTLIEERHLWEHRLLDIQGKVFDS